MATIALRIDDAVREHLAALAAQHDMSMSELLRRAANELLGRGTRGTHERRDEVPATLTITERRILGLLHEIRASLAAVEEPGNVAYHARCAEALYRGFAAEYETEFAGLEPELPRSEASLVWDILDFFTVVEASIRHLSSAEQANLGPDRRRLLTFGGFDLADQREGQLLAYAQFLVADDRWPDLAVYFGERHERGHSHHRTLPLYLTFLRAYEPMKHARRGAFNPEEHRLTLEELTVLGDVRVDDTIV